MKTFEQALGQIDNPEPVRLAAELVPGPFAGQDQAGDLERDMAVLRGLLGSSRVEEARALANDLAVRWPDSDRVQRMARVLAPPVARVIPGPPHRSMEKERAWYRIHAHEYPGCWIAVLGDQLLAADPSYRRVHAVLSAIPGSEDAVLFFRRPDVP